MSEKESMTYNIGPDLNTKASMHVLAHRNAPPLGPLAISMYSYILQATYEPYIVPYIVPTGM